MKKGWQRVKRAIGMCLLAAGLCAASLCSAQAQEILSVEEAVIEDTTGQALAQAGTRLPYSMRSVSTGGYYGAQLSGENEQAMYRTLAETEDMRLFHAQKGVEVSLPQPYLIEDNANRLKDPDYIRFLQDYAKATHAYVRDFCGNYWIDSFRAGIKGTPYGETGLWITTVYLYPQDYYEEIRAELGITDAALQEVLRCADKGTDRYAKVKAAHDHILELVEYNHANTNAAYGHTITGGLLDKYGHLAVCECYSKLLSLICEENNIPCVLITGGSTRNADGTVNATHMWNYVQMEDGNWYLVDATWDDLGENTAKYFLAGAKSAGSNHIPVGIFGKVATADGKVSYDAFSVPTLSQETYEHHVYSKLVEEIKATCTQNGKQVYQCESCEKTLEKILPAGHTPGTWNTVKASTVLREGVQEKRCLVCNALLESKKTAKVPATIRLNASSIPLQVKKSSSALAIASMTSGDKVSAWTSSNTKIVSVNKKTGKLTAKKTGTAVVTVKMKSGVSASCKVKVQSSAVKTRKLNVSKTAVSLKKGASYKIGVVRSPITAGDKISFRSSNKKVATVSAGGKVKAVKKGTAKITVTAGGKKAVVKVTVR